MSSFLINVSIVKYEINVRENRRGNQEWIIQRNWQHLVHKTQAEKNKKKNTTHYALDTTIRKQSSQVTPIRYETSYKYLFVINNVKCQFFSYSNSGYQADVSNQYHVSVNIREF